LEKTLFNERPMALFFGSFYTLNEINI